MRAPIGALGLVLVALPGCAQEAAGPPEDLLKRRVVYSVPGMDDVRVRRDLTYRSGTASLSLDVYLPKGAAPRGGWPVVVLVHGGPVPAAWAPKNWGVFRSYGQLIAASGLAAVTFNHRLHEPTDYPRAADDVAALLDHVRAEASGLEVLRSAWPCGPSRVVGRFSPARSRADLPTYVARSHTTRSWVHPKGRLRIHA